MKETADALDFRWISRIRMVYISGIFTLVAKQTNVSAIIPKDINRGYAKILLTQL